MRSKSEHAWRTAAECAKRAQEADDKGEHEFFVRMRNAWITVANRCEFMDVLDEQAAGAAPSPGLMPPDRAA